MGGARGKKKKKRGGTVEHKIIIKIQTA